MGAVRVQLVGALAVFRDGSGAESSVGSRKARVLLALLAAHRGAHVPLGQIVDALWCEQPPQRPHRAVATLVSRLRAELGRIRSNRERSPSRLEAITGSSSRRYPSTRIYRGTGVAGHAEGL